MDGLRSNRMFCIVKFTGGRKSTVVPDSWLSINDALCLLPPKATDSDIEVLVRNLAEPGEGWQMLEVSSLETFDTYSEAKKKLDKSRGTPQSEASSQRKRKKPRYLEDYTTNDSDEGRKPYTVFGVDLLDEEAQSENEWTPESIPRIEKVMTVETTQNTRNEENIVDKIKRSISSVLPHLPEEKVNDVSKRLADEIGVREVSDLSLVSNEDLEDLKPIERRKLLKAWEFPDGTCKTCKSRDTSNLSVGPKNYEIRVEPLFIKQDNRARTSKNNEKDAEPLLKNDDNRVLTFKNNEKEAEPLLINDDNWVLTFKSKEDKAKPLSINQENWAQTFEIPYEKFPDSVVTKCKKGLRLNPAERRHIVRIIAFEITKVFKKPGRKNLEVIASRLIKDFPASLQDEIGGNVFGNGYESFLKCLLARLDNVSRRKISLKSKLPVVNKKRKFEIIQNVQPDSYPESETEKSQEEKRLWLKSESSKLNYDDVKVDVLMTITYASQRLLINSNTSVKNILGNWPFLRKPKYISKHFEQLMFPFVVNWDIVLKQKIPEVWSYLKTKFRVTKESNQIVETILLICAHFKEENVLLKTYEESVFADEVEKDESCPLTPFLAVFGETNCSVFVEKEKISSCVNIIDGFKTLFASYYVFNIHYPPTCSATMGFIERGLMGIPSKEKAKKKTLNDILKLVDELSTYKSKITIPTI